MAKGYILADIPKNCEECDYARLINGETACTAANLRRKTEKERPEWCPIHDFVKRESDDDCLDEYQDGYDDGWNACIKQIVGKSQGQKEGKISHMEGVQFLCGKNGNM